MPIDANRLMQEFVDNGAADLYLTVGAPPAFRFGSEIRRSASAPLNEEDIQSLMRALINEEIIEEFTSTLEYNTAIAWQNKGRFRVNLFRQRQSSGIVLRRIRTEIPSLESLSLPKLYGDLIMERRGLILLVGPTGSGKSTSLAAMIEYRNKNGDGHIVTIEDPVEFLHEHHNCIVTQRDIGIDTYSFGIGLKNALRQSPDVIVIGEIRDKETMEHAIVYAETGHLCIATLHANNTAQTIERIINFFPQERHSQVLSNLSFNLKAILSQRLVHNKEDKSRIAIEIMLNQGLVKTLIREGRIKEIKECIEKSRDTGMQTFDQALLELYTHDIISEESAVAECDNPASLLLAIKQYNMSKHIGTFRTTSPISPAAINSNSNF